MKPARPIFLNLTVVLALVASPWCGLLWAAAVPGILHFQGRVTTNGIPFHGTGQFKFALVTTNSGPVSLWSQDGSSVGGGEPTSAVGLPVARGLYSVGLGDTSVSGITQIISPSVFTNASVWLRVWFDDGVHGSELLLPDERIGSVAYALVASTVPDGSISASQLAPDALRADRIQGILNPVNLPGDVAFKSPDLQSLSNQLVQQFTASLQDLRTSLLDPSNHLSGLDLPGLTLASPNPADAQWIGRGFHPFYLLPAPEWKTGSISGEPDARFDFGGVWTGDAFLVWGGNLGGVNNYSGQGGSYVPTSDTWTPIGDTDSPSPRARPMVAWTGLDFIVWGGYRQTGYLNSGGAYRPSAGQWRSVSTTGAPTERDRAVAGWIGSRFLVWGGRNSHGALSSGGLYDPVADVWSSLLAINQPEARYSAASVFTTNRVLLWGGAPVATSGPGTGSILNLDGNGMPTGWTTMRTSGAPSARVGHAAVWTGTKLLIWGGQNSSGAPLGDGACYDPVADSWTALTSSNAPSARAYHSAVWTGTEMVLFGGQSGSTTLGDGAAYDPGLGRWRPLVNGGQPQTRTGSLGVWTSQELLVFGGTSSGTPIHALQRVVPASPWTLYRKP
jgi:hypothetical protein